jgi:NitT/TauT family transport system permease protein
MRFGIRQALAKRASRRTTVLVFVWLAALWCAVSYGKGIDPRFIPPPHAVGWALVGFFGDRKIMTDIGMSLYRLVVGFSLAAIIGTAVGLLAGSFPRIHALVMPVNSFVRYVPATALIGLFFLWFGLGEVSKIALVFSGVLFFLVQRVADAAKVVPDEYLDVARTLGARRSGIFWRVILRSALPEIVVTWRVELAAAWIFLIIAEMMASSSGLGNRVAVAWRYANPADLFAALFLIGMAGLAFDLAFDGLYRIAFPYLRRGE